MSLFHGPSEYGKGDRPCRVNKRKFDRNYLRLYGLPCPVCNVTMGPLAGKCDLGEVLSNPSGAKPVYVPCSHCNGLGFVEKN